MITENRNQNLSISAKTGNILIIYGSLNSVPSPEGAAPAKVIYETVITSPLNHFRVLSNYNKNLNKFEYDKDLFKHVKSTRMDKILLLLLKIRYPYKKRREKFITGNDEQLLYYISVCRWLLFKNHDKIIVHVGIGLVQMLKRVFPKKEIIYFHHGTSLHTKLSESQWKLLIKNVRAIFGVNKVALKKANSTFKTKLESSRYFHIENAIIQNKIIKRNKEFDLYKKRNFNEFSYAFTGRVCIEKGVLNLLMAFRKVHKVKENSKLYIIGGSGAKGKHSIVSGYYQECIDFATNHNLPVVFTGFLQKEQLMNYLSMIDVVICPTDKHLYEEGMPLSIIEALSFGKPVITTDSGGNSEVIKNNVNGILIKSYPYVDDLFEGMLRLSEDSILYNRLSKGAFQSYAQKHTYSVYIKKLKSHLKRIGFQ